MRSVHRWDRLRLAGRRALRPALEIDPSASANFAYARFELAPGARVRIGRGAVTERRRAEVRVLAGPGARVEIGDGAWLRTDLGPVILAAFADAELRIGPESLLNGCHLSAKRSLTLGRRVFVGPGSRVFDADQHDLDAEQLERVEPVVIEDHAWLAADVTVLRGVRIGAHAVVGTRSLVVDDVPAHTLAFGVSARAVGRVGDRSRAR